jgi:hypothetical protein
VKGAAACMSRHHWHSAGKLSPPKWSGGWELESVVQFTGLPASERDLGLHDFEATHAELTGEATGAVVDCAAYKPLRSESPKGGELGAGDRARARAASPRSTTKEPTVARIFSSATACGPLSDVRYGAVSGAAFGPWTWGVVGECVHSVFTVLALVCRAWCEGQAARSAPRVCVSSAYACGLLRGVPLVVVGGVGGCDSGGGRWWQWLW